MIILRPAGEPGAQDRTPVALEQVHGAVLATAVRMLAVLGHIDHDPAGALAHSLGKSADRFEFYGGDAILDAARRMPDVRFDVVGRTGDPTGSAPANVHWHGWVSDLRPFYAAATVVVRIPRHDGLGATVIEALLNARYVVYTHEVPFVRTIATPTGDDLFTALDGFRAEAAAGRLGPNLEGRDYAAATFKEEALVEGLMDHLRSAL